MEVRVRNSNKKEGIFNSLKKIFAIMYKSYIKNKNLLL